MTVLAFVFYTNFGVWKGFAATTYGPFVFIRPGREQDVGLREHELVHVRQFWRTYMLWPLFYWFSRRKRFEYEVEAYRKQLEYDPQKAPLFAGFIATKYWLKVTEKQALEALLASR